jgi:hypothetical protein
MKLGVNAVKSAPSNLTADLQKRIATFRVAQAQPKLGGVVQQHRFLGKQLP